MNSVTEQIKERLSIVDVVGTYTKLEKAGTSYKARCPFHNERTPSFFVSPARGSYHCFGCGQQGDIFNFVEQIEGIPFKEVLVMLAERAGVALSSGSYGKSKDNSLFQILDEAAVFYESELQKQPKVLAYLRERGVSDESIKIWRIGYAGSDWSTLIHYLTEKGYNSLTIEQAGLSSENERGKRDRFRERIIFPLMNANGKVVGFSGRLLPWIKSDLAPKYLNSPETDVFHKSSYLYGYHRARKEIAKTNVAIVVEGQFDLIMAHQIGSENTVAGSGTAFTQEHAKILARNAEKIIFVMDGDAAGIKASERAVGLVEGLDVRIVTLPAALDPAECIRTDPDLWKTSLAGALHVIDFILSHIMNDETDMRTKIKHIHTRVYPHVMQIQTEMEREYFIKRIAEKLSLSEASIREDLAQYIDKAHRESMEQKDRSSFEIEKPAVPKTFKGQIVSSLIGIIIWQEKESSSKIDIERIKKRMSEIDSRSFIEIFESIPQSLHEGYGYKAELELSKSESPELFIEELLLSYEKLALEDQLAEVLTKLRSSEGKDNTDESLMLLKLCDTLARRIHEIKSNRLHIN